jgi:hypothetical protein
MAAGAWTATNATRTNVSNGVFLDADSYKIALVTNASNIGAGSTTFAGVTGEVAGGTGYTAGGNAVTLSRTGTTSVVLSLTAPTAWTASGGSIVARYGVLYEVGGNVVAYFLLDSTPADVTVTTGNTLTINASTLVTIA